MNEVLRKISFVVCYMTETLIDTATQGPLREVIRDHPSVNEKGSLSTPQWQDVHNGQAVISI